MHNTYIYIKINLALFQSANGIMKCRVKTENMLAKDPFIILMKKNESLQIII